MSETHPFCDEGAVIHTQSQPSCPKHKATWFSPTPQPLLNHVQFSILAQLATTSASSCNNVTNSLQRTTRCHPQQQSLEPLHSAEVSASSRNQGSLNSPWLLWVQERSGAGSRSGCLSAQPDTAYQLINSISPAGQTAALTAHSPTPASHPFP